MIRIIGDNNPLFVLDTDHTTYAMKVLPSGHIEHLYYGRKIHLDDADGLTEHLDFPAGNTIVPSKENGNLTLEDVRLEMSSYGKGDIREPYIEMTNPDGSRTTDLLFDSYTQSKGRKPSDEAEDDMPRS